MIGLTRVSFVLMIIGLAAMLIGAIDPMEGSVVILAGSGVVVLGAHLARSGHRRLVDWGFALIGFGVGAMFVLTLLGGTGGSTGRSNWWALFLLPYPAGWIMGLAGAIVSLRESRLKHTEPNVAVR